MASASVANLRLCSQDTESHQQVSVRLQVAPLLTEVLWHVRAHVVNEFQRFGRQTERLPYTEVRHPLQRPRAPHLGLRGLAWHSHEQDQVGPGHSGIENLLRSAFVGSEHHATGTVRQDSPPEGPPHPVTEVTSS